MKKSIYLMILVAIISSLITVFVTITCYKMNNQNEEQKTFNIITSNNTPIQVKNITYTPQGFVIRATGLVNAIISHETIKGLKVYEFTTGLTDHIKGNENTYKGVKLSEVIKLVKVSDYQKITLKSNSGKEAEYKINEIDDSLFIVFEKNDIPNSENEPLSFMDLNICDCYNIDGVNNIMFE